MFIKKKENFVCENCGEQITGDGYTNHCPNCLWSKHVDISPGDRASDCFGAMRPIRIELKSGEFVIIHKCDKCGAEKRNKMSPGDNMEVAAKI
ncbi:MAG: RNHCP domain-containing protein [Candidatus Colwellbacteria bacterium]|nr:RNHCP domain-containing protein [Candidatus Colwellbacteria bacterium]